MERNPSSSVGGSKRAAMPAMTDSGTCLARARLRWSATEMGQSKYAASSAAPYQRAREKYGFRSARVRFVASMQFKAQPMARRWRSRNRTVAKTRGVDGLVRRVV